MYFIMVKILPNLNFLVMVCSYNLGIIFIIFDHKSSFSSYTSIGMIKNTPMHNLRFIKYICHSFQDPFL